MHHLRSDRLHIYVYNTIYGNTKDEYTYIDRAYVNILIDNLLLQNKIICYLYLGQILYLLLNMCYLINIVNHKHVSDTSMK